MKKNIVLLIISIPVFILTGCADVLDKYPLDKPSQETFYTNAIEITRGINACYEFFQETGEGSYTFPIVLDCMSDIGFPRQDNDFKTIARGEHDDKSGTVKNTWSRCFQGIGRCNNMLKVIEEKSSLLTDEQIRQFRGEALFLRAYYYARLVTYFGDVPLLLEPVASVSEAMTITRTPKEQVIQQLLADYTEAANLLTEEYTAAADIYRATKGTANAYKARVALYFGMWDVAASSALAVMESGKYELYPKYGDLFVTTGLWDANNREIIYRRDFNLTVNQYHALPQYMQTRNENGYAAVVPSQNLIDSYHCTDDRNISESPLFDKSHPFENRDPRLRLSFVVPGDRYGDYRFEGHADSALCYQYSTGEMVTNKDCYTFSPYTSYTGYNSRKFSDEGYATRNTRGDYPIILCRYAEVLLTYAEAKIELNQIDQSVTDALNRIRQQREDVKMPLFTPESLGSQQQARIKVRHERKIELAFEGFRYTDLRRWGWADTYCNRPVMGRPFKGGFDEWPDVRFDENNEPVYNYNSYVPHPSTDYRIVENRIFTPNKHELWPIPESERNLNPELKQNPGY
jgi:hypothetical protein